MLFIIPQKDEAVSNENNKKHIGDKCRHNMRPSVQLPSISGTGGGSDANSKVGLTMVKPSLQSLRK